MYFLFLTETIISHGYIQIFLLEFMEQHSNNYSLCNFYKYVYLKN